MFIPFYYIREAVKKNSVEFSIPVLTPASQAEVWRKKTRAAHTLRLDQNDPPGSQPASLVWKISYFFFMAASLTEVSLIKYTEKYRKWI